MTLFIYIFYIDIYFIIKEGERKWERDKERIHCMFEFYLYKHQTIHFYKCGWFLEEPLFCMLNY